MYTNITHKQFYPICDRTVYTFIPHTHLCPLTDFTLHAIVLVRYYTLYEIVPYV